MFTHAALILGVSIAVLLLSLILDTLCAPLPPAAQFIVQIPLLVLAVDALRRAALAHVGLSSDEINASFFFAAPLAAFGATTLFRDMRRLLPSTANVKYVAKRSTYFGGR